jgi:hypothetical protein
MTKPQFLIDLERNGYVVVPRAVPAEACAEFRDEALAWLEKFPYGFKRGDPATWTEDHLPQGVT